MADGCRHSSHLTIAPFVNLKFDPKIGNTFSDSDRRITRRNRRLRMENAGLRGKSELSVERDPGFEAGKRFSRGRSLDKGPVSFCDMTPRSKQSDVPLRFVGEQKQPLRVGIQSANRINRRRKSEFSQRSIRAPIRGELREHPAGFVKSEDQRTFKRLRSWESTMPTGLRFSSRTTRSSMRWCSST